MTAGPAVDLNADLGEGFGAWRLGDDEALLSVVTSANVACGFHAGDPLILRRCCAAAAERGVAIGAQVSYRDLAGFGRREMDVPPDELTAEVLYQIAALDGIARAEVTERAVTMATRGQVQSADGHQVTVHAESICVHGDTPGAVELARAVRRGLEAAGVRVAPFV